VSPAPCYVHPRCPATQERGGRSVSIGTGEVAHSDVRGDGHCFAEYKTTHLLITASKYMVSLCYSPERLLSAPGSTSIHSTITKPLGKKCFFTCMQRQESRGNVRADWRVECRHVYHGCSFHAIRFFRCLDKIVERQCLRGLESFSQR
jgi:hypothetical protein